MAGLNNAEYLKHNTDDVNRFIAIARAGLSNAEYLENNTDDVNRFIAIAKAT